MIPSPGEPARCRRLLVAAAVVGAAALVGTGIVVVHRRRSARWRPTDAEVAAGPLLPGDLVHHELALSDGGQVHVVETGAGPPVVLVHGVTLSVETWGRQLAGLSAHHRVIAFDQRGHGRSVAGSGGYTFDRLAADLLEVLEALDVTGAVLVGHSMGGMVALTAAVTEPGRLAARVGRLVLVATSAGPVVGVPWLPLLTDGMVALAGRSLAAADRRGRGVLPTDGLAASATRLAFGAHPAPADVAVARDMLQAMSPRALADLLRSLVAYDVRDRLGNVALPAAVVAGRRDVLLLPFHARRLAAGLPDAQLYRLAGCGHMVMLERPLLLNAIITTATPDRGATRASG